MKKTILAIDHACDHACASGAPYGSERSVWGHDLSSEAISLKGLSYKGLVYLVSSESRLGLAEIVLSMSFQPDVI